MEMEQLWAERYGQNGIMGLDLFWEEGGDVEGRIEHTQKGTFFFFFFLQNTRIYIFSPNMCKPEAYESFLLAQNPRSGLHFLNTEY